MSQTSDRSENAFDDLLDGEGSGTDTLRSVTENTHAEREAARDSVKRAAAHMRQSGGHAARAAHEKAHAIRASVRRHAPSAMERVRAELAKAIRWRVVGPIMVGSVVLGGAVLATLLAWNAHRFSKLDEQGVTAPVSVPFVPAPQIAPATAAPREVPLTFAAGSTGMSVPSPIVTAQPTLVAAPSEPARDPDSVKSDSTTPALPPAPSEPTISACVAAVPLLNGLFASAKHAKTPDEIAWAVFGYRCAQNGALTYSHAGYSAPQAPKKAEGSHAEGAASNIPARASVRATKATSSDPATRGSSVAAAPLPPSRTPAVPVVPTAAPGTCALHGSATTVDGVPMSSAPIQISGLDGSLAEQRVSTDATGQFSVSVPSGTRVRVVLRARGYLDDVRETLNCAPVALTGKKSNPFSSLFDAARRADRSIQSATGRR